MTAMEIQTELSKVQAKIDAAYWAFTRQARAKPPSLVVPEAYRRRTELRLMLRDARRPWCPGCGLPLPNGATDFCGPECEHHHYG